MDELFDAAPCGLLTVSDAGIVLQANATLLGLLGYGCEAVEHRHIDTLLPVASRIFYQTHIFPLLKLDGHIEEVYLTLRAADGRLLPMLLNGARRTNAAEATNLFALVVMHRRAQFEAELLQARQAAEAATRAEAAARAALNMERSALAERVAERTAELTAANAELAQASRLKDEFLASISHELRTPLNAVLGYSQALADDVYGALSGAQGRAVQKIEASGQHLLQLINNMLDFARLGAGQIELLPTPLSVDEVCKSSLAPIRASAEEKQLAVDYTRAPAARFVLADPRRLKQILGNLLANAVKFTPAGGSIGLAVAGDTVAQRMTFTVWDTGIGIAPERLPELFKAFRQLDSNLSRQYEGTGLGLALVAGLVDLHGGTVTASSAPAAGSSFVVALPWPPELQVQSFSAAFAAGAAVV